MMGTTLSKQIGFAIKKARWAKMIKQKDFAKNFKISPSHISEIETGKKFPSVELLFAIDDFVGPLELPLKRDKL